MAKGGYSSLYVPCTERAYYHRARAVLKKNNIKLVCARCNTDRRVEVHHKNKDITNNSLSNLQPLCKDCHILVHESDSISIHSTE